MSQDGYHALTGARCGAKPLTHTTLTGRFYHDPHFSNQEAELQAPGQGHGDQPLGSGLSELWDPVSLGSLHHHPPPSRAILELLALCPGNAPPYKPHPQTQDTTPPHTGPLYPPTAQKQHLCSCRWTKDLAKGLRLQCDSSREARDDLSKEAQMSQGRCPFSHRAGAISRFAPSSEGGPTPAVRNQGRSSSFCPPKPVSSSAPWTALSPHFPGARIPRRGLSVCPGVC